MKSWNCHCTLRGNQYLAELQLIVFVLPASPPFFLKYHPIVQDACHSTENTLVKTDLALPHKLISLTLLVCKGFLTGTKIEKTEHTPVQFMIKIYNDNNL